MTVVIVGSRSIYCSIGSRIVNSVFDPSNSVESVFLVATRSYIIFVSVCVPHFIPPPRITDLHVSIFDKTKPLKCLPVFSSHQQNKNPLRKERKE